jgi:hypothetical protein
VEGPVEKYKILIDKTGDFLKGHGFTKKSTTFYVCREGNWGLLNFQKSQESSTEAVYFTINLGVSSTRIREFLDKGKKTRPAAIDECHWKTRVGFILPDKKDTWWKIDEHTRLESIFAEIRAIILNKGIPEIMSHISDESLMLDWLGGTSEGLTNLQRYIYLTTLLKINNKPNLSEVISEFKKFAEANSLEHRAKIHVQNLGLAYE